MKMAGGSNLAISTIHYEDVNEFFNILSHDDRLDLWKWAKQQILRRAREIKNTAGRREILEAAMGLHEFTSREVSKKFVADFRAIPRFPKTLGRGKYCPSGI
jgi:hypothetical protein